LAGLSAGQLSLAHVGNDLTLTSTTDTNDVMTLIGFYSGGLTRVCGLWKTASDSWAESGVYGRRLGHVCPRAVQRAAAGGHQATARTGCGAGTPRRVSSWRRSVSSRVVWATRRSSLVWWTTFSGRRRSCSRAQVSPARISAVRWISRARTQSLT